MRGRSSCMEGKWLVWGVALLLSGPGPTIAQDDVLIEPEALESSPQAETSDADVEAATGEKGKDWKDLNWHKTLEPALSAAGKDDKPVFIDFTAEWCGWCRRLEQDTYSDPKVWEELNTRFVLAHIDGDVHTDLVQKYEVGGYPCLIVVDSSGEVLVRHSGFVRPESFSNVIIAPLEYLPLVREIEAAKKNPDPQKYDLAAEKLRTVLHSDAEGLNILAWNWLTQEEKNPHSAYIVAVRAKDLSPEDDSILDTLATAELLTGRYDDAIANFRKLNDNGFQGAELNLLLSLAARASEADKDEIVALLRERMKTRF